MPAALTHSRSPAQVKKGEGPYRRADEEVVSGSFSLYSVLTPFAGLGRVDINRPEREDVRG